MADTGAGAGVAARVLARLRERGESVATAESLTGGLVAAALTDVPGSSAVYLGGLVTYATALKQQLLGVPEDLVAEHGVVSAACAAAMAAGARGVTGATWAVATTGVAGPGTQEGHPAGTVFVGVAGPGREETVRLALEGGRDAVRRSTVSAALRALERLIDGGPGAPGRG